MNKHSLKALLYILAFLPSLAYGADFFVAKVGSSPSFSCAQIQSQDTPASEIQQAIDCASGPGDRVIMKAGTYNQPVTVNKAGISTNPFIVKNFVCDEVIIDANGMSLPSQFAPVVNIVGSGSMHVVLSGFSIINADQTNQANSAGIGGAGVDHIRISDVTIDGVGGLPVDFTNGNSNLTIEESVFRNYPFDFAIGVRNSDAIAIIGNVISNAGSTNGVTTGISIEHSTNVLVADNLVQDVCQGIQIGGSEGAGSQRADHVIIRDNTITRAGTAGACTVAHGIVVDGGDITPGHNDIVAYGNRIHNSPGGLAAFGAFDNARFQHNTVFNANEGLFTQSFCSGSTGPSVGLVATGNVFDSITGFGIAQWNQPTIGDHVTSHNLINGASSGAYSWDADGDDNGQLCPDPALVTHTVTSFETATGQGTNSLSTAPLFTNSSVLDFGLGAGSPAIDAAPFFMTMTGAVTDSTIVNVSDDPTLYFIPPGGLHEVPGDTIQVEGVGLVGILSMTTSSITLTAPITAAAGAGVHRPFSGAMPDMGALESGELGAPPPAPAPVGDLLVRGWQEPGLGTTGLQDITVASLNGHTPKAVLLSLTYAQAVDTPTAFLSYSQGFTCDNQQVTNYIGDSDLANPTAILRGDLYDSVIGFFDGAAASLTAENTAEFVSFIEDGVRINWTLSTGETPIVQAVFFAGDALEDCHARGFQMNFDPSLKDITDPGFEPNVLLTMNNSRFSIVNNNQMIGARNSWGFTTFNGASVTQQSVSYTSDSEIDPSLVAASLRPKFIYSSDGAGADWISAEASQFDSQGFSVAGTVSSGNTGAYMAMKVDSGHLPLIQILDTATSTGSLAYTGFGFQPQAVQLIATLLDTVDVVDTTDPGGIGWGFVDDSGFEGSMGIARADNASGAVTRSRANTAFLHMMDDTGATFIEATVTSLDADGMTLNYTTTDGTARKLLVLAWPSDTVGPPPPPPPGDPSLRRRGYSGIRR